MKARKMIVATEHNWGLKRAGDWNIITWKIYYDRSFLKSVETIPGLNDDLTEIPNTIRDAVSGEMEPEAFEELRTLLETEKWRILGRDINACDGVAWKIDFYSPDGELRNSSGKLGYIYGEPVLERIVETLPD